MMANIPQHMLAAISAAGLLAQSRNNATSSVLIWSSGLIIALVVGMVAIAWIRKRMSPTQESMVVGFTLADLRKLRQDGAMTEEEFERAKKKLVDGLKASAKRTENTGLGVPGGTTLPPQKHGPA